MKKIWIVLFILFVSVVNAQNDALARQYMDDGEFEKAVSVYEKLYNTNSGNFSYFRSLLECYQQLERYNDAQELLESKFKQGRFSAALWVEMGYNYQLMGDQSQAESYYKKAIESVSEQVTNAYAVGNAFRRLILLDYAVETYKKAMELNPDLNFNYNLALIYGELDDVPNMFKTYLDLIAFDEKYKARVLNNLGKFISDDTDSENNQLLRKELLKRSQSNQDVLWNELLSWFFVQQKQFGSSFIQEKFIYKKSNKETLGRIVNLGRSAYEAEDYKAAKDIFLFVVDNSPFQEVTLEAELSIIKIDLSDSTEKDVEKINKKFVSLLETHGRTKQTIPLQLAYGEFIAFELGEPDKAQNFITEILELPLNNFEEAKAKMLLADILVYNEQFNRALILYSQVQRKVKNDVIAQDARFKVAKASFYKGDFAWAESQLKVLKSSTSQLIANDALQLKLLISDNSLEDSTQTALKIYAKADLLAYQKKNKEAVALLENILVNHKGESIEDEALLKQAILLEDLGDVERASLNYTKIIEFFPDDILMDDALFRLANLYYAQGESEKAKPLYERIVLEHPDSIFFVQARNTYRKIRGDVLN
ncbi:Tetratricopeptide repeat-containing protein [Zhouia amylolytica]|uniref:Tetratricopeptide repeat-containing protein n=1 Tax=Zhouia amylolytica TaxID=376730 RepID=A0A1I6PDF7_9FLAO|nr:tetratricopeptide repeat protein [Zhouia amylolytica]SFS38247.1 Tetratricopeptide repeat-containing protein [Zhouia amylolytica]